MTDVNEDMFCSACTLFYQVKIWILSEFCWYTILSTICLF